MPDILALLQGLQPYLTATILRQLDRIATGLLGMTGRVTMLGIAVGQDRAAVIEQYNAFSTL